VELPIELLPEELLLGEFCPAELPWVPEELVLEPLLLV
jgi:hypothetical protein